MTDDADLDPIPGDDSLPASESVPTSSGPVVMSPVIDPPAGTPVSMNVSTGGRRRQRISRWDRPPEPHDWRWVVGHIGRALITLGLLMFGFVAYQLWGTGIQTARAQNHLKSEFKNTLQESGITPDTIGPITLNPATTIAPTTTTSTAPVVSTPGTDAPATTTAATTVPPTTSIDPVPQNFGVVKPGDAIAEIKIHKLDLDFYIVAGVGKDQLNSGVGHFPNTPVPGQYGNSVLAGHRTSHLAPFGDLDQLRPGDVVEIRTKLGDAYAYVVTDSLVVSPTDYHVVTDTDPTKATLTLITCTPKFTSKQRLVVHATLDVGASSPIGAAELNYGQDQSFPADSTVTSDGVSAETLPGDGGGSALPTDVTTGVPGVTTGVPDTATPASTPSSTPAVAITSAATTTSTASTTATTVSAFDDGQDAFSEGWFSDSSAFPHVAFWAILLGLVWYGAYRLAKRFRNMWLAVLGGFIPTVLVLYFLYENVNRLLPAAL